MANIFRESTKLIRFPGKMDFTKKKSVIPNYFLDEEASAILEGGIVVECGTAAASDGPAIDLEYKYGWKFFGFEPDPRFYPILIKNRPNGININAALSDHVGQTRFTMSAWGGNSSLNHCTMHKEELISYKQTFIDGSYFKEIDVATMNWNFFTQQYNLDKVDYLILDVEGSELMVLDGFDETSILPSVVQIEYGYSDPKNKYLNVENKENFSGFIALYERLYRLGYEFDYVNHNDAFFSLPRFWENRVKPRTWLGEDERFDWVGLCMYEKEKCRSIIESLDFFKERGSKHDPHI